MASHFQRLGVPVTNILHLRSQTIWLMNLTLKNGRNFITNCKIRFYFFIFFILLFKALEIIPSTADIWSRRCSEVGAHLFDPVTPFILLNSPCWQKAKICRSGNKKKRKEWKVQVINSHLFIKEKDETADWVLIKTLLCALVWLCQAGSHFSSMMSH